MPRKKYKIWHLRRTKTKTFCGKKIRGYRSLALWSVTSWEKIAKRKGQRRCKACKKSYNAKKRKAGTRRVR